MREGGAQAQKKAQKQARSKEHEEQDVRDKAQRGRETRQEEERDKNRKPGVNI